MKLKSNLGVLAQSGPIWPNVGQSGPIWATKLKSNIGVLAQSGPIWPKVGQSGPFLVSLILRLLPLNRQLAVGVVFKQVIERLNCRLSES